MRPFLVNNPELEADLIPSRRDVLLLLRALRLAGPLEDIVEATFGERRASSVLAGRADVLARRRAEAAATAPRRLPSDEPATDAAKERTGLPLQIERGVRRRIERMRMAQVGTESVPIEEARIPEPEPQPLPSFADPEMRHLHELRSRLEERRKRRSSPGKGEQKQAAQQGGQASDAKRVAAEAVRRLKQKGRRDR